MRFEKIAECINELKIGLLKEFLPVDIYRSKELGKNQSVSVKFTFQSDEKTLEDADITPLIDKILNALDKNLGIGIR